MQAGSILSFGAYQLDAKNIQLVRGQQIVKITEKALQVLRYLVQRHGQLATKEELFQAVWPETVVTDSALTVCIKEIRKVLRDDPKTPRYIETVYRRGYRFIGQVGSSQHLVGSSPTLPTQPSALSPQHSLLVGRETELAQLHAWWEKALNGERQVVFISGEPGIGKTTLVDAFRQRLETGDWRRVPSAQAPSLKPLAPRMWVGWGQCIEQYGAGEAYRPVLEAFGRLCRGPNGKRLLAQLERHAPTWLVQMPALVSPTRFKTLQDRGLGATKERMLREMAEAVDAITTEQPLILVLEDLHWSDAATLELLATLARRQEAARLLLLGTYRPAEVLTHEHPLRGVQQELRLHDRCQEMALGYLSVEGVAAYLAKRFGDSRLPADLAQSLHHRTGGNPLFMVALIDYLLAQGVIHASENGWALTGGGADVAVGVPDSLRQLIEKQFDQLGLLERRILEVASVAGIEFSTAAVAAGIAADVVQVEERCEELVRRKQFLLSKGIAEWPDGTVASRYGFLHALYQDVVYGRVTGARRVRLHQQIGEREAAGYGERAKEIAAELAVHFEGGRDYQRAVEYLQLAGETAIERSAHREAINLLTKGLTLLIHLPDTPECAQIELALQTTLGPVLINTEGFGAAEVERVYTRVLALCQQMGETPLLFPGLWGSWVYYAVRGKLQTARELATQLLTLAQSLQDTALPLEAYHALWATSFISGEWVSARAHAEQGIRLYDRRQHHSLAFLYGGHDPGVCCRDFGALALWLLGYPDQARKTSQEALTLAQELNHPFTLAEALGYAAWLSTFCRKEHVVQQQAERLIRLSEEHGFAYWLAQGTMLRGWALAVQGHGEEGLAQLRHGLTALRETGTESHRPYYLTLLADAYRATEQTTEGLHLLTETLENNDTEMRFFGAELYRLKGELTLQRQFKVPNTLHPTPYTPASSLNTQYFTLNTEAEGDFLKAIEIARKQQAKSLELRAVMSLVRLRKRQAVQHTSRAKLDEARQMLTEMYGWFTEGFDTKDLQEAKTLLATLQC